MPGLPGAGPLGATAVEIATIHDSLHRVGVVASTLIRLPPVSREDEGLPRTSTYARQRDVSACQPSVHQKYAGGSRSRGFLPRPGSERPRWGSLGS